MDGNKFQYVAFEAHTAGKGGASDAGYFVKPVSITVDGNEIYFSLSASPAELITENTDESEISPFAMTMALDLEPESTDEEGLTNILYDEEIETGPVVEEPVTTDEPLDEEEVPTEVENEDDTDCNYPLK